jgi:methylmalonyl-CoA mutase C-terminal domain/subunit
VVELLRGRGATDIVVFGGGIIPEEDVAVLKASGVAEVFTPGTSLETIVAWVRQHVKPRGVTA